MKREKFLHICSIEKFSSFSFSSLALFLSLTLLLQTYNSAWVSVKHILFFFTTSYISLFLLEEEKKDENEGESETREIIKISKIGDTFSRSPDNGHWKKTSSII
jgi:hypothetical protein